ncbi:hypothetical protein [Chengkuizengella axinellae]|uniref:Uncharacterized protein n=1 Tax=Chengkuizengella axinellae TaxID=3064388 RepID=A0ABT9IU88_9BACL|nr:hypothetical protein [Chengkuizengella sp. 2205SS18-9]MDP5272918.1 hypothetical protein [Chengkuizengella sp. 2205SS18-9]
MKRFLVLSFVFLFLLILVYGGMKLFRGCRVWRNLWDFMVAIKIPIDSSINYISVGNHLEEVADKLFGSQPRYVQ